jgi:hypothetical protein
MMKFKAVYSLPLVGSHHEISNSKDGWPKSWIDAGNGPTRQMRWLGNREYKKAKVSHVTFGTNPVSLSKHVEVSSLVILEKENTYSLLVVFVNHSGDFENLKQFTHPGIKSTQDVFQEKFSLQIDASEIVRATCVYEAIGPEIEPEDGALMLRPIENEFFFNITYGLLVAALGAERQILESATQTTFNPGVLAHRARRALGLLENWLSVPSSDSTHLIEQAEQLRRSIRLDERKVQVQRSLSHQVRAVNFGVAAFAASSTIGASSLPAFITINEKPTLDSLAGVTVVLLSSIAVGFITWIVTRRA